MTWKTLGQDHLLARLQPALEQGRESHAYLLTGPPHVGKLTLAREIAQAVNCLQGPGSPCGQCVQCQRIANRLHADVRVVDLEFTRTVSGRDNATAISIDAVRELERTVNLNAFEGSRKVIIVDGASTMTVDAANALLKTLEEPPPWCAVSAADRRRRVSPLHHPLSLPGTAVAAHVPAADDPVPP